MRTDGKCFGELSTLLRCTTASLNLSTATMHRILRKDLGYHLYKLQITRTFLPGDLMKRGDFCTELLWLDIPPTDEIFFSDEAHFELNGCIKKQNMSYWSLTNSHYSATHSLHSERVAVRYVISARRFFFQQWRWEHHNRYCAALVKNFPLDDLQHWLCQLRGMWERIIVQQNWWLKDVSVHSS